MLKLSASYSKKVPAEQEYSSKSYHVSLELELPAGLTAEQLRQKIGETFALAKDSVESEIHGGNQPMITTSNVPQRQQLPSGNAPRNNGGQQRRNRPQNPNEPASNKQVAFLMDLLKRGGYDIGSTCQNYGVQSLYDLTRQQCSEIIDGLQSQAA